MYCTIDLVERTWRVVDTTRHQYQMTASRDCLLSIVQLIALQINFFSLAKNTSQTTRPMIFFNVPCAKLEVLASHSNQSPNCAGQLRSPAHRLQRRRSLTALALSQSLSSHFIRCMLKKSRRLVHEQISR